MKCTEKKIRFNLILLIGLVFFAMSVPQPTYGQLTDSTSQTLEQQYRRLLKISTTYQEYKVVKSVNLDEFWGNISDSLRVTMQKQAELNAEIQKLNEKLFNTENQLKKVQAELDASNFDRDHITLLGVPVSKTTYKTVIWIIILVLAFLAILFFSRFQKSNKLTRKAKKDFETLQTEYDNYKKKARDKELKLKRELQTAINTIDELKQ